jgi:hypothetical protein
MVDTILRTMIEDEGSYGNYWARTKNIGAAYFFDDLTVVERNGKEVKDELYPDV